MSNLRNLMDILKGANPGTTYVPGSKVPQSGIYDVIHMRPHTVSDHHQVTCVKNEPFPPCRDCKGNVRYRLFKAAYHLSEHPHLERK